MNKQVTPGEGKPLTEALMETIMLLEKWQHDIESALAPYGDMYTFDQVVASVVRGERQMYEYGDCLIIMQLEQHPGCNVYHCFVACGNMKAIIENEKHINEIAKALNCKYLSISGRTGWPRALKDHGWKHISSVLHKEVS